MRRVLFSIVLVMVLQACSATQNSPVDNVRQSDSTQAVEEKKRVVIVPVLDERGTKVIGKTDGGARIEVDGDVACWATETLYSVLHKAGYEVISVSSMGEAVHGKAKNIVIVHIHRLSLEISQQYTASATILFRTITGLDDIEHDTWPLYIIQEELTEQYSVKSSSQALGEDILLKALAKAYQRIPKALEEAKATLLKREKEENVVEENTVEDDSVEEDTIEEYTEEEDAEEEYVEEEDAVEEDI